MIVELNRKPTAAADIWPEIGWGLAFLAPLPLLFAVALYCDYRKAQKKAHTAAVTNAEIAELKNALASGEKAAIRLPASLIRLNLKQF